MDKNDWDETGINKADLRRYKNAPNVRKSKRKRTPVYLQLAIIKMESDFDWLAKPPRQKLFKVIPYKRPSSSFGYSQAVNGTWEQYKKETGNKLAIRSRFKDSVDFIGWYTNRSSSILKISKKDAFKQYIAYHEGWGGFKNYKNNKKVINLAKRVEKQSNVYKNQLKECSSSLSKNKYIIFQIILFLAPNQPSLFFWYFQQVLNTSLELHKE